MDKAHNRINENSGSANRISENRRSEKKYPAESVSKGYRLKPETHELVELLSEKINGTKDQVISRACKMFSNSVNRSVKKKENQSGNKQYKSKTN